MSSLMTSTWMLSRVVKTLSPKKLEARLRYGRLREPGTAPDPEIKAFLRRMMPNHPMLQDDD